MLCAPDSLDRMQLGSSMDFYDKQERLLYCLNAHQISHYWERVYMISQAVGLQFGFYLLPSEAKHDAE